MTEEIPSPGALSAHIQRQREAAVPRIEVEQLSVALGGQEVLRDVSVVLHDATVLAVLGPSGSGKSTLLRAIAGLVSVAHGAVRIAGRDVTSVPAHRRGVGFVFQDHALFPHRDVTGNVEFGLRMAGMDRSARRERVAAVLALVGLEGFERRDVLSLSGGERQRVALARALAPEPGVLLLDEPFAALDRTLRDRLVDELGSLLAHAAVPTVLVTHDHDEAFALGRHVAVLHEGRLVQQGTPETLWHAPCSSWAAGFLGFGPTAEGRMLEPDVVDTPWGRLNAANAHAVGSDVVVVLRPDALRLDPAGRHSARVERVVLGGAGFEAHLRMGHGPALRVRAPGSLVVGATVAVRVDPRAVLVYPPDA